ncbi:MAG: thioredoxin family protein [Nanoarchaeota archaeon]|nr:thioredoxin family protein [Nanoarchaeota archaeon]
MEVIEYSSKHCSPCQEMKSELKKLKKAGFKVSIVDCDKNMSECRGIQSVPTLIIKKGRRSKKMVGFMTAEEIKSNFDKL